MNRADFLKWLGLSAALLVATVWPMRHAGPRILYGDGEHDDTEALQAWYDGGIVVWPNGRAVQSHIVRGTFAVSGSIVISSWGGSRRLENATIERRGWFRFSRKPMLLYPTA